MERGAANGGESPEWAECGEPLNNARPGATEVREEKIPARCLPCAHREGEFGLKSEFTITPGDKQAHLSFGESLREDFTRSCRSGRAFVYALKLIARVLLFVSSWSVEATL